MNSDKIISGWNDADRVLPPIGVACEVDVLRANTQSSGSPMKAVLVRLPSRGDYAWANGENEDFRVGGVRRWRLSTMLPDRRYKSNQ